MPNKLVFDEATHTYRADGLVVPSVTQILQAAGLIDFSKVNPAVLEAARKFGIATHLACEYADRKILDENALDNNLRPLLYAWVKFQQDYHVQIIAIEEMVYSETYQVAGRLDRRATVLGRHTVIDLKTQAEVYPANAIQTAAYQNIWNEKKPAVDKILDRLTVSLFSDGTYKVTPHKNKQDWPVFLSARNIAIFKKEHDLWK